MSGSTRRAVLGLFPLLAAGHAYAEDADETRRAGMVANIRQLLSAGAAGGIRRLDGRVTEAMRTVPRHLFVPEQIRTQAYSDDALEIGHEATISQPLIVALMTHLAEPRPTDVVLEVGTGSGYQAAVLSGLVKQVYTIELVEALAQSASERLARLGYSNVAVRAGDGYAGWPEHAPFDSIVVTAGAPRVPPALVRQLKPGGRMVIPVGPRRVQQLTVVEKSASGRVSQRALMAVNFVPLRETR